MKKIKLMSLLLVGILSLSSSLSLAAQNDADWYETNSWPTSTASYYNSVTMSAGTSAFLRGNVNSNGDYFASARWDIGYVDVEVYTCVQDIGGDGWAPAEYFFKPVTWSGETNGEPYVVVSVEGNIPRSRYQITGIKAKYGIWQRNGNEINKIDSRKVLIKV